MVNNKTLKPDLRFKFICHFCSSVPVKKKKNGSMKKHSGPTISYRFRLPLQLKFQFFQHCNEVDIFNLTVFLFYKVTLIYIYIRQS